MRSGSWGGCVAGVCVDALVFNPGSNSLKAGIIYCGQGQRAAFEGTKRVEVIVEGIGKEAKLSVYDGKKIAHSEPIEADDFAQGCSSILHWLDGHGHGDGTAQSWKLADVGCVGVRVVHGGRRFKQPTKINKEVEQEIAELGKWAPLHNHRSVEILAPIREALAGVPLFAVFDTAFHATIPDKAALYAIPYELSQKHEIRRYGFHGISHRYLMERYAAIVDKKPEELKVVTLHLESGCSATAILNGKSVENTMGMTPLEGLMMGTRCGDIDAAMVPFLMEREALDVGGVMEILEKKSGLLGVSGKSLDTRVLMRAYDSDDRVRLAMEMFSYRVLKAVSAYLGVLQGADAVIFGGGIGENTGLVRERVCSGLRWCGLEMDEAQNAALIDVEGRLSTVRSAIQAYVIPAEETLQIAHECCVALEADAAS